MYSSMKKLWFLIAAAAIVAGCDTGGRGGEEGSTLKRLPYGRAELVSAGNEAAGTDRYLLTMWSGDMSVASGDDFGGAGISLSLEIIGRAVEDGAVPTGTYAFSTTSSEAGTIVASERSMLNVITAGSYGGSKARITGGEVTVTRFNDRYEVAGELTDAAKRCLEFSFFGSLSLTGGPAVVDFEDVALLPESGGYSDILWGRELAGDNGEGKSYHGILYSAAGASFGSLYGLDGGYEYWGGFAFSSNYCLEDVADYSEQFSAAASDSGTFAVGYAFGPWSGEYGDPTIVFENPVTLVSVDVANDNKTYSYCRAMPKLDGGEDIWIRLTATGYRDGEAVQAVNIPLAEGADVVSDWTKVDLSLLGEVDKVVFTMSSNDANEYGMLAPAYFCIDNLVIAQ